MKTGQSLRKPGQLEDLWFEAPPRSLLCRTAFTKAKHLGPVGWVCQEGGGISPLGASQWGISDKLFSKCKLHPTLDRPGHYPFVGSFGSFLYFLLFYVCFAFGVLLLWVDGRRKESETLAMAFCWFLVVLNNMVEMRLKYSPEVRSPNYLWLFPHCSGTTVSHTHTGPWNHNQSRLVVFSLPKGSLYKDVVYSFL